MNTAINAQQITAALKGKARDISIAIVDETASTNTDLLLQAHALKRPTLLLALKQTDGRGRNGKTWHSSPHTSLTFSLAWPLSQPENALTGLSLAVGTSLAQTLRQLGTPVMLKWPNDILKDGKKLAGILIERPSATSRPNSGENWVIIGIGINLQLPDALERQISQPAAETLWLSQMDKNLLMASLLNPLAETLEQFDQNGLAPFVPIWNALHFHAGKKVVILHQDQPMQTGIVAGIDIHGRLLLDNNGSRISVSAGDVSLRPLEE